MKPAGGLKLQLQSSARDDRRVRFAEVAVEPVGGRELDPGRYRLQGEVVPDTFFTVRDRGWTPLRVSLS
jgi:hypothetical protein